MGTRNALRGPPVPATQSALAVAGAFGIDTVCPLCKSDTYLNPNVKLLISITCGHKLCDALCINRMFNDIRSTAVCPYPNCGERLRRDMFTVQTFDDLDIEREVNVRKRVSKGLPKSENDFPSLRDFNDYLEDMEDIVYNLTYKVDVYATNIRLDKLRIRLKELQAQRKAQEHAVDVSGLAYQHRPTTEETHGPAVPSIDELILKGYTREMHDLVDTRTLAGGFVPAYICLRALEDAYSCLFLE